MQPGFPDDALAEPDSLDPYEEARLQLQRDYWALEPYYSPQIAQSIIDLFDEHLEQCQLSGMGDVMWQAYCAYHLLDEDAGPGAFGGDAPHVRPMEVGEQGEFLLTDMSHYRNLVKHKKTLVTGERLAFQPQAATDDGDAMEQVSTARHVLDYVTEQRGLGRALDQAVETSTVLGSAYIALSWDAYLGDPTGHSDPNTGSPLYTGDLRWDVLTPFEVAHQRVRTYDRAAWHIYRTFESRYDVCAKLLDSGDARTAQKVLTQEYRSADYRFLMPTSNLDHGGEAIPLYTLVHDRTPAVPNGRMAVVTGDGLVLWDGPLPYPRGLIYRFAPNEFLGTAIAFADSWSWLALHEIANAVMSPILSRIDAFGHPVLSVPEGGDWSVEDFSGYRLHERPMGSEGPALIDFATIPNSLPEIYKMFVEEMGRISGINSVVRGDPNDNISSGSMAALVKAQAITFNSDDEEDFVLTSEACALGVLQLYRAMASEQMLMTLAGKEGERSFIYFKRESIRSIQRVHVKRTNALMRTTEWKQEAANVMLANGLIKTPQDYLSVVETGTYSSLFADAVSYMAAIREENAMLLQGKLPEVMETEPFHLHVREHCALITPGMDPQIKQLVLQHIQETMEKWQEQTVLAPGLLLARDVPTLPAPQGMPQPGGEPPAGAAPAGNSPEKPGPKAPQTPGVDNKAKTTGEPNMPSMPKSPDGSPIE